jgi:alpha-maltose-1-phosphate synthase
MKKPKVLLAHPGTQHSRYLAIQLYKQGLLYKYCTGLIIPKKNWVVRLLLLLLPPKWVSKFNNRLLDTVPTKYLKLYPLQEMNTVKKLKDPDTIKEELFFKRNEAFQKNISLECIKNADVVIGFDTSAWILSQRAKRLRKKVVIDQTTAEPEGKAEILQEVSKTFPDWKFDLQPRYEAYAITDPIEYDLADGIVVASTYTKETLIKKNVDEDRIFINPYGTDIDIFTPTNRAVDKEKIKFLFVGAVSALKGVPLLLEAWEEIGSKNAELLIAGFATDEVKKIIGKRQNVKLLGAFPKEELPVIYNSADVFVFPSYTDGFGQVILEAMASGLPVITTLNTGGRDVITDGEEGFIIPAGSKKQLKLAIDFFITQPEKIEEMSAKARMKATVYTWESYGERWKKIINEVLLSKVLA